MAGDLDGARVLRLARAEDAETLSALITRSGLGLSAGFYTDAQAAAITRYVFGVDTQLIVDGTYFVIEHAGVIVACGGWSRRRTLYGGDQTKSGDDPLLDPATEAARIRAFFVDPHMARRGLGRMLLTACTQAARDAGFTALELMATLPGVPLYAASGFEEVERIERLLPEDVRVPMVRMRMTLAAASVP